jgi:hypothetical protein
MKAIIYRQATGEILRSIEAPQDMLTIQAGLGESLLIISDMINDETNYVSGGEILLRQAQGTTLNKLTLTADAIDTITLTNAPSGTFTATNTATRETVTGPISGTDTFSTAIPGTYKIKIESWPYLDFEAEVVAS